jgi:hypothetical protein
MSAPLLLCDAMLGKLARWLRLLGYDTAYEADVADDTLLARAAAEGRILLTRDAALATRAPRALRVRSLEPEEQLREALRGLGLQPDPALLLSRCSVCNAPLLEATRAEAEGHVPASVLPRHERYWRCPRCARWYWRGTHAQRFEESLRALGGLM